MDPATAFMLSMEAAGMIAELWDKNTKQKTIQQGRALEKAFIDANMEALNYESLDASVSAMQNLRTNLGTQIAMNAARGTTNTMGAAVSNQKSISNYNSDEQKRRMNLLSKEAELRAHGVLSGLHTLQSETQLGRETADIFKSIPVSASYDTFRRSDLGKKWGFGLKNVGAE